MHTMTPSSSGTSNNMPGPSVSPIQIVKRVWERIAPLQLAERSWDNVGIIIESPTPKPSNRQVLLTIDLTSEVCDEALSLPSCAVVVSYHPPIFRALKSMTMSDPLQASLLKLSARGISIFSPHTSLDATPNGINTWLVKPFSPLASSSKPVTASESLEGFDGAGMGKVVQLKEPIPVSRVVEMVKRHLGLQFGDTANIPLTAKAHAVQLSTPRQSQPVGSIAVCAGSGASLLKDVEADLLLTGEMSHHEVLAARAKGQHVVLCNHTNTERPYLAQVLQPWLKKELDAENDGEWSVVVSQSDEDPLTIV